MTNGESDLGGFSLFELFKAEAETHCRTLNEGLLKLEERPDDLAALEPLMRAAHSLKGAARIIGLDLAVTLAHAMEDVFVAAQKGKERLASPRIDQLLEGTDTLAALAATTENELPAWSAANEQAVGALCERLGSAPPEAVAPKAAPPPAPPAPEPAAAPSEPAPAAPDARTVRVSGDAIDQMMRLAGEMTIESRRFAPLRSRLTSLRRHLADLDETLEHAAVTVEEAPGGEGVAGASSGCRLLAEAREQVQRTLQELVEQAAGTEDVARRVEETANALYHATIGSRMRPFVEGTHAFPRLVRDVAKELGKQVRFEVRGGGVAVDRDILAKLEAPLNHMIRNALDHGIELPEERSGAGKDPTARITLEARHRAGMLEVRVSDDGRGIDPQGVRRKVLERGLATPEMAGRMSDAELLEFLFLPGFSTAAAVTAISGRGVGLDVVQRFAQEVGGTAAIESRPGMGTSFHFDLPVTLSVMRAALVHVAEEPYAFPLARLDRVVRVPFAELGTVEGKLHFELDGASVGLVDGAALFALPAGERGEIASILVLAPLRGGNTDRYGLLVDRFLGESDLVVRSLPHRLGKVANIAAAALLETGEPVLIVDVEDLMQSMVQLLAEGRLRGSRVERVRDARRKRVLVVDDSLTVREVERQLLTRLGYEVDVAVDGVDGLNAMHSGEYDLVVSDVDMPRMNGVELTRAIRREARFATLPIVIVSYKDREEDRLAGLEAGANAYLTKGAFRDESFVRTVRDLIGDAESAG